MRRIVVTCFSVLFLVSCHNVQKPEKPKNLIPKEKMAHIILDMSLLSAARGIDINTLEDKGILPKEFIYDKYQIDSLQFAESNNYYAYDVVTYEAIYDMVKDSLEVLKDESKAIYDEENDKQRKKDSLEKAIKNPKLLKFEKDSISNFLNPKKTKR